jgi:hypothetical protein
LTQKLIEIIIHFWRFYWDTLVSCKLALETFLVRPVEINLKISIKEKMRSLGNLGYFACKYIFIGAVSVAEYCTSFIENKSQVQAVLGSTLIVRLTRLPF